MSKTVRKVVLYLGVAAAAGSILGALGSVWWGFDLMSNFRLHYLLVLLVAATAVVAGNRLLAVVFGVIALYNALLIVPLYVDDPVPAAGPARLEIVSSNLQLQTSRQQVNWIVNSNPDMVFLFESSRRAEDLLRAAGIPYEVISGIVEDEAFGVSILSRDPLVVEPLPFARDGGDAVRLETELGDERVVIYAIHPPSPSNPFRAEARDRFLARVGAAVAEETLPVIVVGDFNATPWSAAFGSVAGPGDLINSQRGFGYGATWPAGLWPIFGLPLDHLLHSGELTTVEREVGPSLGPDHRPIRVVLASAAG